jgi:hypothetical protein
MIERSRKTNKDSRGVMGREFYVQIALRTRLIRVENPETQNSLKC